MSRNPMALSRRANRYLACATCRTLDARRGSLCAETTLIFPVSAHSQTPARQTSFEEFVVTGSARLLRSAYLLTGDRDDSEDLLQITLVRTARRWDAARQSPHAYAHRTSVMLALLHS
jgi:Sigma-70 region 2